MSSLHPEQVPPEDDPDYRRVYLAYQRLRRYGVPEYEAISILLSVYLDEAGMAELFRMLGEVARDSVSPKGAYVSPADMYALARSARWNTEEL